MNLTDLSNEKSCIFRHPYLLSAFLCFLTAIFTFGDQTYFSAESILIIAFVVIVLIYKKINQGEYKEKNIKLAVLTVLIAAAAMLFCTIPYKGEIILAAGLVAVIVIFLKMYKKKQITAEKTELIVILFAFLMYTSYVLYTVCTLRQIDVGYIDSTTNHAGYINYLYDSWLMMPDFDPRERWMFFHAPLWHMVSALWLHFFTAFGIPYVQAFESIQILSLFCSFCIVITSYKIFRHFNLNGYALVIATAIIALCNTSVMLSGSINNDTMMAAFEIGAIYCALKWYRDRNFKNILMTALCVGLGMMTKLSAWVVAPPIAFLFIYAFFKDIRSFKKYICQFLAFLAVCAPLGLWFPIYNYIRFGVPIGYVPPPSNSDIISESVIQRLFDFSLYQFETPILYTSNYVEFNPLVSLFKSSVDLQRMEFHLDDYYFSFSLVLYSSIVIGVMSFIFMIFSLFSKKVSIAREYRIYMAIFYATLMTSYYSFCIKFPYFCTENVRYIYPVILIGALFAGMMFKYKFKNKILDKIVKILIGVSVSVLCLGSIVTFLSMGVLTE